MGIRAIPTDVMIGLATYIIAHIIYFNGIGLKLPSHGITVVWDWEWSLHEDTSSHSSDNEDQETTEQKIHTFMHSDSESSHESLSDDEVSLSTQTHTASALDTIPKTCYSKLANPFQM